MSKQTTIRELVMDYGQARADVAYWQDHGTRRDGNLEEASKRRDRLARTISARIRRLEELASHVLAQPGTITKADRERLAVSLAEAVLGIDAEHDEPAADDDDGADSREQARAVRGY